MGLAAEGWAAWVEAAGTWAAFGAALVLLNKERQSLQIEREHRLSEQARLVSAGIHDHYVTDAGGKVTKIHVEVENRSQEPIYTVLAHAGESHGPNVAMPYQVPAIGPMKKVRGVIHLREPLDAAHAPYMRASVRFTDAAGVDWHRDRLGRLTRVGENAPRRWRQIWQRDTA